MESVVSALETWSSNTEDSEWRYVSARSIRALCQFGESDASELFAKAKAIAEAAQREDDFSLAEECWIQAIRCARITKCPTTIWLRGALHRCLSYPRNVVASLSGAGWWPCRAVLQPGGVRVQWPALIRSADGPHWRQG